MNRLSKTALSVTFSAMTFSATVLASAIFANSSFANGISVQNSTNGIVAKVNDEIVLKSELLDAMSQVNAQAQARGANLSNAQLQKEALDLLIIRKLQLGIIKRAGFTVNDQIINRQMLQIAQEQGLNSLQALQQRLDSQQAGSYASLRNELIEEAGITALTQQQLASRIKISNAEINAFLASPEAKALNPEEYRTTHIRVPYIDDYNRLNENQRNEARQVALRLKSLLEQGQDLHSAMQNAKGTYSRELQGADTGFNPASRLPNELVNAISSLSVGQVSQPIVTPSGVDIVMLTDKRSAYIIPEWHTSHLLIKVDANQSAELAEQKINDIYRQLQQGANFESLAATYSDDTGSATQRGSLGWVSEGQMVPEFEAMIKNTEKGDFSTPFTTQFGYHILKVNNTRQRDASQEMRRAKAEEVLFNRQAPQAQEDWIQELKSSAYVEIIK